MYYKENWHALTADMTAWWQHEMDRPLVQVVSPRADRESSCVFDWWALLRPDVSVEQVHADFIAFCENTWFGGMAFPNMFFNLGPGVLAAYSSGYLLFEPGAGTSWFENPQPWEVVNTYRLQDNEWWRFTLEGMEYLADVGKDRYIMGMTDLGGILDVLSSFRGAQDLAMDLLCAPEQVHRARARILADWHRAYDELLPIVRRHQDGMGTWMGLWCPGTWYPIQCDFAALISPAQFEEFILPDVAAQCQRLDYSIFHLDGPGQIPHLDLLLDIEALDGIQWVPGTGNPQCEAMQWRPLYEKILARGKSLVLQCFDNVHQLAPVLEGLPRKGVFISTYANSEEEGRALLDTLSK